MKIITLGFLALLGTFWNARLRRGAPLPGRSGLKRRARPGNTGIFLPIQTCCARGRAPSRVVYPAVWAITLGHLATVPVCAQVLDVNQFKVTVCNQTSPTAPAIPNFPDAYYFGTYLDTDPSYFVTNVYVLVPNQNDDSFPLPSYTPTYFEYGSPFYAAETNFDEAFPGGAYDYNFDFTDASSNTFNADILFNLDTNDLYAASIPAFTPTCWAAMQAVDPAQNFVLSWNSYALTPGADYAETFISITDIVTGDSVSSPTGPPEETSTNIPAGTLQYGRTYSVNLYFSERQNPVNTGYGGTFITVGWDILTQTTLTTLPLCLHIAPAGTNVTLSWPADASNYHLETTANLSSSGSWAAVTNLPVAMGTTNILTLPAGVANAFFRLATVGN